MTIINPIVSIPALLAMTSRVGATRRPNRAGPSLALPPGGTYALDPPHTFVVFAARHVVVGMVRGRFDRVTGNVVVASAPADCDLDVSIDVSSLSTQNVMRDEDLRGPGFFDAANYPTASYRARGIREGDGAWILDGMLTIRGHSVAVPLSFTFGGTAPAQAGRPRRLGFHGTAATKRADFGMTRELASELGPNPTGPDVWLEIDAEALTAEQTPGA